MSQISLDDWLALPLCQHCAMYLCSSNSNCNPNSNNILTNTNSHLKGLKEEKGESKGHETSLITKPFSHYLDSQEKGVSQDTVCDLICPPPRVFTCAPNGTLSTAWLHVDAIILHLIGAEVILLLFLSFMFATLVTGE